MVTEWGSFKTVVCRLRSNHYTSVLKRAQRKQNKNVESRNELAQKARMCNPSAQVLPYISYVQAVIVPSCIGQPLEEALVCFLEHLGMAMCPRPVLIVSSLFENVHVLLIEDFYLQLVKG
jgi:hypothetical protein